MEKVYFCSKKKKDFCSKKMVGYFCSKTFLTKSVARVLLKKITPEKMTHPHAGKWFADVGATSFSHSYAGVGPLFFVHMLVRLFLLPTNAPTQQNPEGTWSLCSIFVNWPFIGPNFKLPQSDQSISSSCFCTETGTRQSLCTPAFKTASSTACCPTMPFTPQTSPLRTTSATANDLVDLTYANWSYYEEFPSLAESCRRLSPPCVDIDLPSPVPSRASDVTQLSPFSPRSDSDLNFSGGLETSSKRKSFPHERTEILDSPECDSKRPSKEVCTKKKAKAWVGVGKQLSDGPRAGCVGCTASIIPTWVQHVKEPTVHQSIRWCDSMLPLQWRETEQVSFQGKGGVR